jgi:hypothetical protein
MLRGSIEFEIPDSKIIVGIYSPRLTDSIYCVLRRSKTFTPVADAAATGHPIMWLIVGNA